MVSTISEYKAKKDRMISYLGGKCNKCDSVEDLQIDHIDHTNKDFTVTQNWGRSWDILLKELDKCQLLCKTCHLDKSINEGSLAKGWTNQRRCDHGTATMYTTYKCRCDLCKKAKSEHAKQYKLRKKLIRDEEAGSSVTFGA